MNTCATCEHMRGTTIIGGSMIAVCTLQAGTPYVPQHTRAKDRTIEFWRVPVECPIYLGSKNKVPVDQRTTLAYKELPRNE
jgi:hypothetical protein